MNRYEVVSIVGEGAYGVVLKCINRDTQAPVAVKRFRETEENEFVRKSFLREVKLLRLLRHPNIVSLLEVHRRRGALLLVFEFVPRNLLEVLEEHPGGLPASATRSLAFQLGLAIECCHRHGVLHRDIKPENLLVGGAEGGDTASLVLKLCDFGLARPVVGGPLTDYVATLWYRSPELLVGTTNYTTAVDMWALGCILGELATGEPVFACDSEAEQLAAVLACVGPAPPALREAIEGIIGGSVPPPEACTPLRERFAQALPPSGVDLLCALLSPDPAQRPTASEALAHPFFAGLERPQRDDEDALDPAAPLLLQLPPAGGAALPGGGAYLIDDDAGAGPAGGSALEQGDRLESPGLDDIAPRTSPPLPPALVGDGFGPARERGIAEAPDVPDVEPLAPAAASAATVSAASVAAPAVASSSALASEDLAAAMSRPWVGSRQARVERQRRGVAWQSRRVGGGAGGSYAQPQLHPLGGGSGGLGRAGGGGGHFEVVGGPVPRRAGGGGGAAGGGGSRAPGGDAARGGGGGGPRHAASRAGGARSTSPLHASMVALGADPVPPPPHQRSGSRAGSRGRGTVQAAAVGPAGGGWQPATRSSHASGEGKASEASDEALRGEGGGDSKSDDEACGGAPAVSWAPHQPPQSQQQQRPVFDLLAAAAAAGPGSGGAAPPPPSRARALGLQEGTVYASALSSLLADAGDDDGAGAPADPGGAAPLESPGADPAPPLSPSSAGTGGGISGRTAGSAGRVRPESGSRSHALAVAAGVSQRGGGMSRRPSVEDLAVSSVAAAAAATFSGGGYSGSGSSSKRRGSFVADHAVVDTATLHSVTGIDAGPAPPPQRGRRSRSPARRPARRAEAHDPPATSQQQQHQWQGRRDTSPAAAVGAAPFPQAPSSHAGGGGALAAHPLRGGAAHGRRDLSPAAAVSHPVSRAGHSRVHSGGGREASPPHSPPGVLSDSRGSSGMQQSRGASPSVAVSHGLGYGLSGPRRGQSRGRAADVSPPPSRGGEGGGAGSSLSLSGMAAPTGERVRTPSRTGRH